MNILNPLSGLHASDDLRSRTLPPQVLALDPRERQIASVSTPREMTAKEVEEQFDHRLHNGSIRMMLRRLCAKGILMRRKVVGTGDPTARRNAFLYAPVLGHREVRECTLRQLAAADHFGGSLLEIAQASIDLLRNEQTARP